MNRPNSGLIKEWIWKADGDFEAATTLFKSGKKKKVLYVIAFHCQQALEKYLKALLICRGIKPLKTHDLIQLLNMVTKKDPFLIAVEKDLHILNPFSVAFRYPGEDIELAEVKDGIQALKRVSKILKKRIREFI